MESSWSIIVSWLSGQGVRILIILAVGAAMWFILKRFVPPMVHNAIKRAKGESKEGIKKRTDTLVGVLMGAGKVLIVLVVIFMILSEVDINITPILAGLGIVGIGVGFGAQYLIRDLIAGIFVILENQYRVGDVARVADITGLVEEINLRKTVLRDLDGIVHHVPNGEIRVASNYSRHFSRVNINIPVAYGEDLDHVIAVINRVGKEMAEDEYFGKLVLAAPQVLRVDNFGDSSIDIKVLGDTKPLMQWEVTGELRKRIKKVFDEEDIEIPWPHIKLYMGESKASGGLTCQACSGPNPPGSKFCAHCGTKLTPKPTPRPAPKTKKGRGLGKGLGEGSGDGGY
jgi:small-conductance mechanosensitive channel